MGEWVEYSGLVDKSYRSCMGVGRCSDLGGRHFIKQQKCDFLLLLMDTNA